MLLNITEKINIAIQIYEKKRTYTITKSQKLMNETKEQR